MKFYTTINEDGKVQLVATKAEVKALKQTLQPFEVPTDKDGLLKYINSLLLLNAPEQEQDIEQVANIARPAPERGQWEGSIGKRILEEGRELDQIAEWIRELEGWRLAKLLEPIFDRLSEIKKEASKS